jgi:hypothetical protein
MASNIYTLTIQPGLSEFEELVNRYIKRTNYGSNMTIYTFDNKISALLVKKRMENEGYNVHLEDPDGTTKSTETNKIYAGLTIN